MADQVKAMGYDGAKDAVLALCDTIQAPVSCAPEICRELADRARLFVRQADEQRTAGSERAARLQQALDRDVRGLAQALGVVRSIARGYGWLGEPGVWGSYEWDDQTEATLRAEMERCLSSIGQAASDALRRSGDLLIAVAHDKPIPITLHDAMSQLEELRATLRRLGGAPEQMGLAIEMPARPAHPDERRCGSCRHWWEEGDRTVCVKLGGPRMGASDYCSRYEAKGTGSC